MFDWLFDNRLIIGVLLCAVLAAFGAAWWRTRKKQYAISAGVVLLLLAVYGLLAWFLIETSSQLMKRRVIDMAESVERKDIKATLEKSLTEDFRFGQYDKKGFIEKAQQLRDGFGVSRVDVWNFTVVEHDRDKGTAKVHFNAKPITSEQTPFYLIKAVFVMKPKEKWSDKEEWKMQSFEYFNPVVDANSPLPLP